MDIYSEFERFKTQASTPEGFQKIEDAWSVAANYEIRDGQSYKKSASDGDLAGFAIDPITWKFLVGPRGHHHKEPWEELITKLYAEEHDQPQTEDPYYRVIDGRIAYLSEWQHPIVCILNPWQVGSEIFPMVEEKILALGIGLPFSGICMSKVVRH